MRTIRCLERVKFLAIFASNLDEFFMVRVAGLREQAFGDMLPQDPPADGLKPLAQLQRIAQRTEQLVAQQYACWNESIVPALAAAGIRIHAVKDLDAKVVQVARQVFPPGRVSRCSRRWRSTRPIPARGSTIAGCTWRRCSSGSAASARSGCSPWCKCRRCCRGSCPSSRTTSRTSCCWKT